MPNRCTRWSAAMLAVFALLGALACGQPGHFIPGESPTVTPRINPQGTPSAPIVITPDLPEGWRWQHSPNMGFNALSSDTWLLLGVNGAWKGGIHHTPIDDCWRVFGLRDGGHHEFEDCHSQRSVGGEALKLLAVKADFEATPESTWTPTPMPTATPNLSTLSGRYQAYGQELHESRMAHNRGVVMRWADGSHWEDGISHELPDLPLDPDQKQRDGMTCAQAEVLESATFPDNLANRGDWHRHPHAAAIAAKWEERHAEALWGDHSRAVRLLKQDVFTHWCGYSMRP